MRIPIIAACLAVSLVAPVAAQRAGGQRPTGGRTPASALLMARETLALTPEQVTRLEALAAAQAKAMPGSPGDALRARADMVDALKGEGDPAALRRALDRMHQLRAERAVAALRFRQEARAVLTSDQRTKADAMRASQRMARNGALRRGGAMGRGRGGDQMMRRWPRGGQP